MKTPDHKDLQRRLYHLLPAFLRASDAETGYPLRALLSVLGHQADLIQDDIARLYDNWFIETCDDWVVPYIAELVGYLPVPEAYGPDVGALAVTRRREAAHTISSRRRKGTLALLTQLARDVGDWPARAVELREQVQTSYHVNFPRPQRAQALTVRDAGALARAGGPFDSLARVTDVRRLNSSLTPGKGNVAGIALFVWRLKVHGVDQARASVCTEPLTPGVHRCHPPHVCRYLFSPFGNDLPLYNGPPPEPGPQAPPPDVAPPETALPGPIRRFALLENKALYYGPTRGLYIWRCNSRGVVEDVDAKNIVPANLAHWQAPVRDDQVAVDPELGRLMLVGDHGTPPRVWVRYFEGAGADLGGGSYPRGLAQPSGKLLKVKAPAACRDSRSGASGDSFTSLQAALETWAKERQPHEKWTIEICDNQTQRLDEPLELREGDWLEIRAGAGYRPVLAYLDRDSCDVWEVGPAEGDTADDAVVILDGLWLVRCGLRLLGPLSKAVIRHCTLVPGRFLSTAGLPQSDDFSLECRRLGGLLEIESSIVGPIRVGQNEEDRLLDPPTAMVKDSILDSAFGSCPAVAGADEETAPGAPQSGDTMAYVVLNAERTTVLGAVKVHAIDWAQDCLFRDEVTVARRQRGCMRFCYAPRNRAQPARAHCQPDLAIDADPAVQQARQGGVEQEIDDAVQAVEKCMIPVFRNTRFGTPTYAQLDEACPRGILHGAHDESEMGAFHDLYRPQREAGLRARLEEYTLAGAEARLFFTT
jgi:hypothetical protein